MRSPDSMAGFNGAEVDPIRETSTIISARNFLEQVHGSGLIHVREEVSGRGDLVAEIFYDPKQPVSPYEPVRLLKVVPSKAGWEEVSGTNDRLTPDEIKIIFSRPNQSS